MSILKDTNKKPLEIGKCYRNIGEYVKRMVNIKDDTDLGKLYEIEGIYGSDDPNYRNMNKIYKFKNNNILYSFDEYFITKQKIKIQFKEVSCDDFHSELPRYSSNESQLSLTLPPEYEEPIKYEPPPAYEKKTFGNTLSNTFGKFATRLTRGTSPPYTESGGKKNKKKRTRKNKKRTTRKRSTSRKHRKHTRKH